MWGYKLDLERHKNKAFLWKEQRKGDCSARLERIGFVASHLIFLTLLS